MWSSPVLCYFLSFLSHVSTASRSLDTQHFPHDMGSTRDIWLTTVHFQTCQADSTFYVRHLHSPRWFQVHPSRRLFNCHSCGSVDYCNFESHVLIPFHFFILSILLCSITDIIWDFIPLFTAANYFNMTVSNKKALATLNTVHKWT